MSISYAIAYPNGLQLQRHSKRYCHLSNGFPLESACIFNDISEWILICVISGVHWFAPKLIAQRANHAQFTATASWEAQEVADKAHAQDEEAWPMTSTRHACPVVAVVAT